MLNTKGQRFGQADCRLRAGAAERSGSCLTRAQNGQGFRLFDRRRHLVHDRHRNAIPHLVCEAGKWRAAENNDIRAVFWVALVPAVLCVACVVFAVDEPAAPAASGRPWRW